MGLLPCAGIRSPRIRLLKAGILLALAAGALTTVLPFLLMVSGGLRSGVDQHELRVIPAYLYDDAALYRKYIEALYNESPASFRAARGMALTNFATLQLPAASDLDRIQAWRTFLEKRGIADHEQHVGFAYTPVSRGRPWQTRNFLRQQRRTHQGEISRLNDALETDFADWNAFLVLPPDTRSRLGQEADTPWWRAWRDYVRREAPAWSLSVHSLNCFYHERITAVLRGADAPRRALTIRAPAEGEARADWELFVREAVHPAFVRMDPSLSPAWRELLRARYGDLSTLRQVRGVQVSDWSELDVPSSLSAAGPLGSDWLTFLEGGRGAAAAELGGLWLDSADLAWRALHGDDPPLAAAEDLTFLENRRAVRRLFFTQNFATAWEILAVHGRGLRVTVIYCLAAVALALLVNPLAAYALSRYRPRSSYAMLLYLLLTMAFPPMVTQIPLFLMLRDFQMLNTYWALLLPGMAHGYSIFLLKGFFDSLPRDLYESAALDGAGELCMFRVITLSLSKPILAVIALGAFVNAYSAFMFALLICQDERMWTLMVWLFQLQQQYGSGVMNAAFTLAALPTLGVFLLAQRFILRGIVIPTEK